MKATYNPVLIRLVKRQGLTLKDLAEKLKISRPTLMAWLEKPENIKGYNRAPLAKALGITITELDAVAFKEITLDNVLEHFFTEAEA